MKWFALVLLLAMGCGTTSEQKKTAADKPVNRWASDAQWAVLQAQEHRDIEALCALLQDDEWETRRSAALAFASVQDSASVPCLLISLNDSMAAVRAASAFALGLSANASETKELFSALNIEEDPVTRQALLEAAGRIGDERALEELLSVPANARYDSLGIAWGVYRMAIRKVASEGSVERSLQLLSNSDKNIRLAAAHVLGRTHEDLLKQYKNAIAQHLERESSAEVRMALIRAYGNVVAKEDVTVLSKYYATARTLERVNILRAMGDLDDLPSNKFLREACKDTGIQVAIVAATVLSRRADLDAINQFHGLSHEVPSDEVAMVLDATLLRSLNHSKSRFIWQENVLRSSNVYVRANATAMALERGKYSPIADMVNMAISDTSSKLEMTAATQAIFNWLERNPKLGEEEFQQLGALLRSDDAGILADVATYITSNITLKGNDRDLLMAGVSNALSKLGQLHELEAKILLQDALAHLKGEPKPEHQRPTFNHPLDRERLNALPNGQEYVINTTQGDIRMITFVDEAPGSCLAFDSLVTTGFYNGKYFHRVVPNFVAQGGCPRGDGYGSMDWTLRTEVGLSGFGTGAVGLASAGPDTESCQFFITHSPTPHLDGRYTRFGQVVEGMDVVNELGVGDVIMSITKH